MTLTKDQIIKKIAVAAAKRNIEIKKIRPLRLLSLVRVMASANFASKAIADKLIDRFLDKEAA